MMLTTPAQSSAPATSQPALAIVGLEELDGAYVEVVNTAGGLKRSPRCGPDDQLIFERLARGLRLRWGVGGSARDFPDASIERGRVVLRERRRTITLERYKPGVLWVRFTRKNGRERSYLYGKLMVAKALPLASQNEPGCEF